ncbi:MAG: YihY/virulence factor BrkB family protein [Mollicutes bacterium PWAP]|nr:YihY/virulence factor BrkB family protein [Mollicutes bacterium PWAP]
MSKKKYLDKKEEIKEKNSTISLINDPNYVSQIEGKHWLSKTIFSSGKKVSFMEKLLKFIIYMALRLVTKPKKWKDKGRGYKLIDEVYESIISASLIYIPSSISFYFVMAFMPILSFLLLMFEIPQIAEFFGASLNKNGSINDPGFVAHSLGRVIPGFNDLIKQLSSVTNSGIKANIGGIVGLILILLSSTWISSGGMSKLVFTQSYIFKHKYVGGYWINKIRGMFMVIAFALSLFIFVGIIAGFDKWIELAKFSNTTTTSLEMLTFSFISLFWIFIINLLLFKFSPRFKIQFKYIFQGAMIVTFPATILIIILGFTSNFFNYGQYATFGVVMFIGMFSLLNSYFIYIGITVNAAYYRAYVDDNPKDKWSFSKK